jgi:hypothetical protein
MAVNYLDTHISLPPGLLPGEVVRAFLEMVLCRFRWFEPRRYGQASLAHPIQPGRLDLDALVSHYEERRSLCVAAKTDRDFFWISPVLEPVIYPYTGKITWATSVGSAAQASWRAAHVQQVHEVMRLVHSSVAYSAVEADLERKKWRLIDRGDHQEEAPTVRGDDEGLAGLFWRNFYGPPFVRLFGERLSSLPAECLRRLGDEVVLVQPYELPTEAGTEAGVARERDLLQWLGPECFYNHEHHTLPARRPVLSGS